MKTKKRKCICQNPRLGKSIKVFFKVVDWVLFIGFCILACYFMKNVIDEYQAKKTSFTQSLEPITKLPTIVICLESSFNWLYGKEVNISYRTPHTEVSLEENQKYDLRDDNEVVEVNQYDGKCFKINSTIVKTFEQSHYRIIQINIIEYDLHIMPEYLHIYFTSEENSYGISLDWWDGNVFEQKLDWRKYVMVNLKPFEFRYLGDDSRCSKQSNIARFKSFLRNANLTKCPEKCSPTNFLNDLMPSCGWEEDRTDVYSCAFDVVTQKWFDFKISHGFKKPCKVLEYQGEKTYETDEPYNETKIHYQFAPPMMINVQQEYLVFDLVGMIGSAGGTLGMCIGFSFSGVTTYILNFIQARIINCF